MLIPCRLNHARAAEQLDAFKHWLDAHDTFGEREVVAELRSKLDLCLLIQFAVGKGPPDRYKHEMTIQGAFRADFVVGCTTRAHFVLVEFESGERNSLFKRGTNQMRDWAPSIQHAFSQVSDWSWAKNDNQKSDLYRNAFGADAHVGDLSDRVRAQRLPERDRAGPPALAQHEDDDRVVPDPRLDVRRPACSGVGVAGHLARPAIGSLTGRSRRPSDREDTS
ncbi:MAG: DUF4263 domain-containing protein [Methylobacterium frigidaeris]